jgi:archaemetzincin
MKVGVLGVGQIPQSLLDEVAHAISGILPDSLGSALGDFLAVPEQAYNRKRGQYNSTVILNDVRSFATGRIEFHRIIGLVDVDIYTSGLNYVFGEAYAPGIAGLVSLWRLKSQFYGEAANPEVFLERTIKEVVHELGHTLGLQHCPHSYCVMHFSNSIFDTDKKQSLFCDQHYLTASIAIDQIRQSS